MTKITTTKHGYEILAPNKFSKYERIFCKDEDNALADIRELIEQGHTLEVHNMYQTFYGCAWGNWLMKGTADIADAKVTGTWDAWGDCAPYPSIIVLTPKMN